MSDARIRELIDQIDRTRYNVTSEMKVLDRALRVLSIARAHGVDGLMSPEIAQILREKYRVSTTDSAVRMALGNASKYVDRRSDGRAYRYFLMEPGETYLSHQENAQAS